MLAVLAMHCKIDRDNLGERAFLELQSRSFMFVRTWLFDYNRFYYFSI